MNNLFNNAIMCNKYTEDFSTNTLLKVFNVLNFVLLFA